MTLKLFRHARICTPRPGFSPASGAEQGGPLSLPDGVILVENMGPGVMPVPPARGRRKIWGLCLAALCAAFLFAVPAEAITRGAFLAKLLEARGLDWSGTEDRDGTAFMVRTGLVTDAPGALNAQVLRREALRWCVQSLGLSFEAGALSNVASGFEDTKSLSAFERGCLFVGVQMDPPLLSKAQKFRGDQRLSDKEMAELLSRVRRASRGLTLDAVIAPLEGLTLHLHRDGVPTGTPRWRVFADGFQDKNAAVAAQAFFKSKGFEMSPLQPQYEWFLRSSVMEDYGAVRRLADLIRKRGLSTRILPSVSNPDTEILPRYWAMLRVDPGRWRMVPAASREGPRTLTPLSGIMKDNGLKAAINAGFFAVTGRRLGYPIGVLKMKGGLLNRPYTGRGCLGWNGEDEAAFGVLSLVGESLMDQEGEIWDDMPSIIQSGPLLIEDGTPLNNPEGFANSLLSMRHPRSVVGLTAEGEWFFLAVDGRNGLHASGATMGELTQILQSYGVSYALNLDGGGSTELVVNGRFYNSPSEGKERPISYALGLRPRDDGE